MNHETSLKPKRVEALTRQFCDELLVYDDRRHKAHCLNKAAAMVWLECNGNVTIQEIAAKLQGAFETDSDTIVQLAVMRLRKAGLIETSDAVLAGGELLNRRVVLKRLRAVAIVAIPIVTSMLVPTPARAASCLPLLASCTSNAQCCSGHCGVSGASLVCLP
jgi:Coenzyme PQQ synthesis protein D (PqqD)